MSSRSDEFIYRGIRLVGDEEVLLIQSDVNYSDGTNPRYVTTLGGSYTYPGEEPQPYLDSADQEALKAYFKHRADERQGNFRSEKLKGVVARKVGAEIRVFCETTFEMFVYRAETLEEILVPDAGSLAASEALALAHALAESLNKPWWTLEEGEVWSVTYRSLRGEASTGEITQRALVTCSGDRCFFRFADARSLDPKSNRILSAERLLP